VAVPVFAGAAQQARRRAGGGRGLPCKNRAAT